MTLTPQIANSFGLWIACIPLLLVTITQAALIYRKAKKTAPLVQLTPHEQKTAFTTGLVTAVGPCLTSFIAILALQAAIGSPVALQRVSVISAPVAEMRACDFTATANNITLGMGMPLQVFNACLWVMAINGCGWWLFCLLFTDKMDKVTKRLTSGSAALLSILSVSAILAIFCYMGVMYFQFGKEYIIAFLGAVVARLICDQIAKKHPKIIAWSLSISLVAGMTCGQVYLSCFK